MNSVVMGLEMEQLHTAQANDWERRGPGYKKIVHVFEKKEEFENKEMFALAIQWKKTLMVKFKTVRVCD